MPSKQKSTSEPDDFELDFPPLNVLRKRAEKKAKTNNIEEIFESENENESLLGSNSESNSNNDSGEKSNEE